MKTPRKISTGVEGLDRMLNGGLIEGRPYSVVGCPGAGKSILGWHFLLKGAVKGEETLYITLDEPHYEIRENMASLGIFDDGVRIMDLSPEDISSEGDVSALTFFDRELPSALLKYKPTRVVLDSTTSIRAMAADPVSARRRILSIMRTLSDHSHEGRIPLTSLLLTEVEEDPYPMETYLSRGVIRIHNHFVNNERIRALAIEKMRGTDFDRHLRPMSIGPGGIVVESSHTLIARI